MMVSRGRKGEEREGKSSFGLICRVTATQAWTRWDRMGMATYEKDWSVLATQKRQTWERKAVDLSVRMGPSWQARNADS
jgi:hypothetical protein